METWKKVLGGLQAFLFVACGVDGVCTILGVPYTDTLGNVILGNILSVLFFLPLGAALIMSWRQRDLDVAKLIRLWSVVVLGGSLVLLIVIYFAILAAVPKFVGDTLTILWTILNLPTINCSIMIFPVFAWAVIMISSNLVVRGMVRR